MANLTHIVDGERHWNEENATLFKSFTTSLHPIIIMGLKEAIKQEPTPVEDYLVFNLDPIVIELHEDLQLISLVSEHLPSREFGYSRWKDLFTIIREYWLKAHESTGHTKE
jgi:hypothetical protein